MSRDSIASVFSFLDREVWLLTAQAGAKRAGCTVTIVSQASIVRDLPRVWVGMSPQHLTSAIVKKSQGFRLHLLDESQFDLAWKFGTQSGYDVDKFADCDWPESEWGRPQLANPVAWLECAVESLAETGDRLFFLARVLDGALCSDKAPLTFRGFRHLLSPAQVQEMKARLVRDEAVDADLMRRWNDAGQLPLAIRNK